MPSRNKQTEIVISMQLSSRKSLLVLENYSSWIGSTRCVCPLSLMSWVVFSPAITNNKRKVEKEHTSIQSLVPPANDSSTVAVWRAERLPIIRRNHTACVVRCPTPPPLFDSSTSAKSRFCKMSWIVMLVYRISPGQQLQERCFPPAPSLEHRRTWRCRRLLVASLCMRDAAVRVLQNLYQLVMIQAFSAQPSSHP